MGVILSRTNAHFQALKRLAGDRKERRERGSTVIEGLHLCEEMVRHKVVPLQVVCSEGARKDARVEALLAQLPREAIVELGDALFPSFSQVENGVGVACVIAIPKGRERAPQADALLIDRLQDPGNLGSILRSAAAAGISAVFCAPGTADVWSPKVLRAGMGAHFALSIHEDCDLKGWLVSSRLPALATSSHASKSLFETSLTGPLAWIFGNEGAGISTGLSALAQPISIPQPGGGESLNVAAAAAVCLFEQVRQRGVSRQP